jgi:tape measure domain-containing protein
VAAQNGFDFGAAWVQIVPSLRGASKAITAELAGIDVKKVGKSLGGDFTAALGDGMKAARKHVSDAAAPLRDFVAGFRDARAAQSAFTGGFGTLGGQTRRALDPIAKQIQNITGRFTQGFNDSRVAASTFSGIAGSIGGRLRTAVQPGLDVVARLREGFANSSVAASSFSGIAGSLGGAAARGVTAVRSAVTSVSDVFGKLSARVAPIGSTISSVFSASASAVASAFNAVRSVAGGALSAVGGALTTAAGQLSSLANSASTLGGQFMTLATPLLAAAGAASALAATLGFKRLVGIDTAQSKLQALGHSTESVELIMDSALAAVKGTAFGLGDAANVAAAAVAAGVKPGNDLERTLSLVGDAAAIAGVDMQSMGSIFNKVAASGKAQGDVLAQLGDAGVPIVQFLAQELGVTAEEVYKLASAGEIGFADFQNALETGLGGAAQIMGQTSFVGAWDNVKAAISRVGAAFLDAGGEGGGFFSQLKPLMADFTGALDNITPKAAELGEKVGAAFATMIEKIRTAVTWWQNLNPEMQGVILKVAGIAAAIGPALLVFGKITSIVGGAVGGIGALASGFGGLLGAGGKLTGLFTKLGPIMKVAFGPVGIIVGLIGALIASSPELQSSLGAAFGEIATVIGEVAAAVAPLIQTFVAQLMPVFQQLIAAVTPLITMLAAALVPVIQQIAQVVVQLLATFLPVFTQIVAVVLPIATQIINALMPIVTLILEALVPVIQWLLEVVSTVFAALVPVIQGAITVVGAIFSGIVAFISDVLGPIFTWLYENIIKPIWNAISTVIGVYWAAVQIIFTAIVTVVRDTLAPIFTWLYENIISPVWESIKGAIDVVGAWFRDTLSPIFTTVTDGIGTAFEGMRDVIKDVWDAIKKAAVAPINFVINTVYNDGIKALIDGIAKGVGLDLRMPPIEPIALASGGVLPGYTPGRDVHKFYSPTGGMLHLSGGEGIIRPDALRALGGKPWLDRVNAARSNAGQTHFADGGIWDWAADAVNNITGFVSDVANNIGAVIADPLGAIERIVLEPVKDMLNNIGGGMLGEAIVGWPIAAVKGIGEWFKKKIDEMFAPGGEDGGYDLVPGVGGGISYQGFHGGRALARLIPVIQKHGLYVTSTWDTPARNAALGRRKNTYHADWMNPAVDMAGTQSAMFAAASTIRAMGGWRQILWQVAGHYDHIHVARDGGVFGDLDEEKLPPHFDWRAAFGGVIPNLYDEGGWLQPGLTLAYNATGKPEPVLTSDQWDDMRRGDVNIYQKNYMPTSDPNVIGDRLAAAVVREM